MVLLRCGNVYSTSLIEVEFVRFQQGVSITGHSILIFLGAQIYIADMLDSTGTNFGLEVPHFQLPSLTIKESVFRIIIVDTIWSCHLSHFKQVLSKITGSR